MRAMHPRADPPAASMMAPSMWLRSAMIGACTMAVAVGVSCERAPRPIPTSEARAFDVPRLSGVEVDGDPADWDGKGFVVGVLCDAAEERTPEADLDATARLGWDERGLLVLVTVTDDVALEDESANNLWRRDSVELFVATGLGARDHWHMIVAPGGTPGHPETRSRLQDHRRSEELRKTKLAAPAAGRLHGWAR